MVYNVHSIYYFICHGYYDGDGSEMEVPLITGEPVMVTLAGLRVRLR
jgi:hypothetical protein